MSMSAFNSKMINHAKETELKERTFPGISKLRQDIRIQLDEFSTKQWMKRKKEKAFKTLKKTAKVIKACVKPGKNLSESSVGIMRPLPSIPASYVVYGIYFIVEIREFEHLKLSLYFDIFLFIDFILILFLIK